MLKKRVTVCLRVPLYYKINIKNPRWQCIIIIIISGNGQKLTPPLPPPPGHPIDKSYASASALTPRALHTIQTKGQPCLRGVHKMYVSRSPTVVSLPIPFSPQQCRTMKS